LNAGVRGTGTYLPMTFLTSGTEKLRIAADTTGTYTFGGTAPRITGDFSNATIANRVMFQTSTTNGATSVGAIPNGTGQATALGLFTSSSGGSAALTLRGGADTSDARVIAGTDSTGVTSYPMTFYTGGSERLRIDTSGNVGIGTSSPASTFGRSLHLYNDANTGTVASNTYLLIESSTRNAVLDLSGSSSSTNAVTFSDTPGTQLAAIASTVADQNLVFRTGGTTERMRIDSPGNVGIGTSSPASRLDVRYAGNTNISGPTTGNWAARIVNANDSPGFNGLSVQNRWAATNSIIFEAAVGWNGTTNGYYPVFTIDGLGQAIFAPERVEAMRITNTGNVLVGTSSVLGKLTVGNGSNFFGVGPDQYSSAVIGPRPANDAYCSLLLSYGTTSTYGSNFWKFDAAATHFSIFQVGSERLKIDSGGNLLLPTASAYLRIVAPSTTFDISGQPGGYDFLRINANGNQRFQFNSAGQAYSNTGTWGTISDVRLKDNIYDATPKLNDLMQLRVVNYNLKSDPEVKQLGFIAQEVQEVFPGLVEGLEEDGEGGHYKAVKTTVLIPILVKAIQEQQAIIQTLIARVAALESN